MYALGTVTDGEFCSLRSQGETRPLHIWQLIHDSKEVVHLKGNGVYFSLYIYVPEVDPITKDVRHDRSDHNHLFRRAVKSIRDGNHQGLNFEAFDDVLLDPGSGLTHAALIGLRKQSLVDAERLVSKFVVR